MNITLTEILTNTLKRNRPRTAVRFEDSAWSYGDLDDASDIVVSYLQQHDIGHGDRVALYLRNCWEYVVSDIAIAKLGAIKIPLNEYQSAQEVRYIVQDTEAKVVIAHHSLLAQICDTLKEARTKPLIVCVADDCDDPVNIPFEDWSALTPASAPRCVAPDPNDIAMITYTGGTTGKPKGVVQTQQSLAINLFAHVVAGALSRDEVMMLTTPLPHSAGYHMQACFLQGGTVLIKKGFTTESFYRDLGTHGVTWTFLVPTMIYRLIDHTDQYDAKASTLKTIVYGAAPMSTARLEAAIQKFGRCFIQLFGQTECPNYITTLSKEDHDDPDLHASCGRAAPMVSIRTDAEDGKTTGEILVRAPYLLKEYYGNADQTAKTLINGWLHTGDIGFISDDGYLFLQDRAKDMIISGGLNVYSNEVEQVLKKHELVIDAAVIGIPHPDWGELVAAVVVVRSKIEPKELIDHCRSELSKYKVPKSVYFRDTLPLTPYNKVDKKALRLEHQSD